MSYEPIIVSTRLADFKVLVTFDSWMWFEEAGGREKDSSQLPIAYATISSKAI